MGVLLGAALIVTGATQPASAAKKKLTSTPTPAILGTAQVGTKLTAKPGTWKPKPVSLSYQWYIDGKKVAGATRSTWLITPTATSKKVTVKVTGKRSGYKTVSRTSKPTAKIEPAPTDHMDTGATLSDGRYLTSANGHYSLVMQADGNLVLYQSGTALWSTATQGADITLVMQADGNLVMYEGPTVRWSSNTADFPGARLVLQDDGNLVIYRNGIALWDRHSGYLGSRLSPGIVMDADASLRSPNHRYLLIMQTDGNLVLYDTTSNSALWSTETFGPNRWAVMQADGNLVVYEGSAARWSSGTAGQPGARLEVQNDANVVIYRGGTAVWDRHGSAGSGAAKIDTYVAAHPSGTRVGDGQCVALVKDYLRAVWGQNAGAIGNAVDYQPGRVGGRFFAANGWSWHTGQDFQKGDVLVWSQTKLRDGSLNTFGHVAIWFQGDNPRYDQNGAGGALTIGFGKFFNGGGNVYSGYWRHP